MEQERKLGEPIIEFKDVTKVYTLYKNSREYHYPRRLQLFSYGDSTHEDSR